MSNARTGPTITKLLPDMGLNSPGNNDTPGVAEGIAFIYVKLLGRALTTVIQEGPYHGHYNYIVPQ